ncbi:MAG: NAD(P)-binding domain-containing protein, partial [Deltaproteobacteria bacterium]|nr:NAD(P)-binding domain-containing protein [Deltaproteobacteria bacterium]
MNYGFIGLGNMGSSIIRGMVSKGNIPPKTILGYDVISATAQAVVKVTGIQLCASNLELVKNSDVVVLGVKPQMLSQVLAEIKSLPLSGKLFLSIATGKDLDFLQKGLGQDLP